MKNITFYRSSRLAEEDCFACSQSQANLVLQCKNGDEALLVKLTSHEEERSYFVWALRSARHSEEVYFCAAFREDVDDIPPVEDGVVVEANEIFCRNGYVYYLHKNKRGKLYIRRFTVLSSQDIVECLAKDEEESGNIDEVYMVRLYAVGNGLQPITTAWAVVVGNIINYYPVFDEDLPIMEKYSLGSLLKKEVKVGVPFVLHKKIYSLARNEEGKLFLQNGKNIKVNFNFGKQMRQMN